MAYQDYNRAFRIEQTPIKANPGVEMQNSATTVSEDARKFFFLHPPFHSGDHGLKIVNRAKLIQPGHLGLVPAKKFGLPVIQERPILRPPEKGKHSIVKDLTMIEGIWLVSERFKNVVELLEPDTVEFCECDVFYANGRPYEQQYYLCAFTREIDAIDLEKSVVKIEKDSDGTEVYDVLGYHDIRFMDERVGDAHVFHQRGLPGVIIDSILRKALEAAGIVDTSIFGKLTKLKRH